MSDWINVFAPASVANVGPGFDILGFAVNQPGDIVKVRNQTRPGIRLSKIHYGSKRDEGRLPTKRGWNTAEVAASNVLQTLQKRGIVSDRAGVELRLQKGIPLGGGLGGSGASAAAAAWAVNLLFGAPLAKDDPDLITACAQAEAALSGFHADNVAPAMLGGFMLIRSYQPLEFVSLGAPERLVCVLVSPRCKVSTKRARRVLPRRLSFREIFVPQSANIAGLVAGILTSDLELLGRSIDDRIVEPARAELIPGYWDVKHSALEHGALGCSISGSGPSVFAVTDELEKGEQIGRAMADAFERNGLYNNFISVSHVNRDGAQQVD